MLVIVYVKGATYISLSHLQSSRERTLLGFIEQIFCKWNSNSNLMFLA